MQTSSRYHFGAQAKTKLFATVVAVVMVLASLVACAPEEPAEPILASTSAQPTALETEAPSPTSEAGTPESDPSLIPLPFEPFPEVAALDPESASALRRIAAVPGRLYFSPDMQMLQWITEGGVTLLRAEDLTQIHSYADAECLVFSPNGELVAWMLEDNSVVLWEIATNQERTLPEGLSASWCGGIEFSSDGRYFVTEDSDPELFKVIKLWDLKADREVGSWGMYQNAKFSPDGRSLAMQSNERFGATLIDIETRQETQLSTTFATAAPFYALKYGPIWETFAFYARSGGEILDVASGETTMAFIGDTVGFSPDGATLATAETGWLVNSECSRAVCLYDIQSERLRAILPHLSTVWTLAFSPDGRILATVDDDLIRLWDVDQATEITNVQAESEDVWSIGFSPDGRYLMAYARAGKSEGHIVELWAAQPATEATRIQFEEGATTWATEQSTRRGETKRYVLHALAGQTMQVFISSVGTGLSIYGEDGTVLKGNGPGNPFWRGKLPLTQDYFIGLHTIDRDWVEDSVLMSIAIAPPGQESQSIPYSDPDGFFELEYSDYFAIDPAPDRRALMKGVELLRLVFVGTEFFEGTNLREAFVAVARSDDPAVVADCMGQIGPFEQDLGGETINGQEYSRWGATDAGMSHLYSLTTYRTARPGACYEVILNAHSLAVGVYPPEEVVEFDSDGLMEKVRELLRTLEFTL